MGRSERCQGAKEALTPCYESSIYLPYFFVYWASTDISILEDFATKEHLRTTRLRVSLSVGCGGTMVIEQNIILVPEIISTHPSYPFSLYPFDSIK